MDTYTQLEMLTAVIANLPESGAWTEGIEEIEYKTEWIDDDALFDADYEAACESEWEWMTGR